MSMQGAKQELAATEQSLVKMRGHAAAAATAFTRTNEKIAAVRQGLLTVADNLFFHAQMNGYADLVREMNLLINDYKEVDQRMDAAGMIKDENNSHAREGVVAMQRVGEAIVHISQVVGPQDAILDGAAVHLTIHMPSALEAIETYEVGSAALQLTCGSIDRARQLITQHAENLGKES